MAIEVKRSARVNTDAFKGLSAFLAEYPMARAYFLYGGDRDRWEGNIRILPVETFLKQMPKELDTKALG